MPGGVAVTVLLTLLNDPRVGRALESLAQQRPAPTQVLVADGGSRSDLVAEVRAKLDRLGVQGSVEVLTGSVARTRNLALSMVAGDIVAFLDADEVAPSGWLQAVTAPIADGRADFTGGPTKPLGEPRSRIEAYVNAFDEWFYRTVVAMDITFLPMGNSSWRTDVLRTIGGFDERFTIGGEDYDVTLRAVAEGHRGLFLPEAWVYHDQRHLNSLGKLVRRRYRYSVGAVMAYRKNRVLRTKVPTAARVQGPRHPLGYLDLIIKPMALVHGTVAWARRGG